MKIHICDEWDRLRAGYIPKNPTECRAALECLRRLAKMFPPHDAEQVEKRWASHYSKRRERLTRMYWAYIKEG